MSEKSHAANVASFHHRGHGMDEATKAAAWSLATVLLSMHILPVSIACGSFWTFSVAALIAADIDAIGDRYFKVPQQLRNLAP
jgi:hypothetical protein